MSTQIFVNLPVKDLNKTIAFFTELGYTFNPKFTDEKATCMIISEHIYAMLLVEPFFKTFIDKDIADATKTTEVLLGLTVESREAVDARVQKAVEAGGKATRTPVDHGWMYQWGYEDLDGHMWEVFYIDETQAPA